MGRHMKNNLEYFSHDNNMRNDKKLLAVRNNFDNMLGYGLYCAILEAISEEDLLQIPYNDDSIEILAGDFRVSTDTLKVFLEYCIKINLFQIVSGFLVCKQLEKRADQLFSKRGRNLESLRITAPEMSCVIDNRSRNPQKNDDTDNDHPDNAQSKVKYSKVKKSISKEDFPEIDIIYNFYPSRCPINGRSTGKSSKCKDKIAKLISDGVDLRKTIEWYIADCKKTNTYLKNFATFLNNVPEMPTVQEQQAEQSQPMKLNRTPLHLVKFKPYPKVEDDWTDEEFQEWSKKEQERIREMCSMKSGGANV